MTNPIDGQRGFATQQSQAVSGSKKISEKANKIDTFIRGIYPEVHRSDVMDTLDYAMNRLRGRKLSVEMENRENSNMVTPHDPRVSGT